MPEPLSSFYSTHLNSRVNSIETLACRNLRMIGAPLNRLEIARDQAYEAIAKAVELYSQYTELDHEFLIFDSDIYSHGRGIKMDNLFSTTPELSANYDPTDPDTVVGRDYDLNDWRRVADVKNIEVGENHGTNILFTVQYAMIQQMGALMHSGGLNKGFDLITWYNMNEFLELRDKMLALKHYIRFDPNTQMLRIFPEPKSNNQFGSQAFGKFFAIVECYVEPRFRDCLKNHWVQEYSLALMKIMIANVRGKYDGVSLLGQGHINWSTLMDQGRQDKEKLEEQILNGTGGFANGAPPLFLVQ